MKKNITILFLSVSFLNYAQTKKDSIQFDAQKQQNAAQRILSGNFASQVTISGYGEINYNQPEGKNGELNVTRMVLLVGYNFDERTQFVSEIEYEDTGDEISIEQAFLNYNVANNISLRGGLMIVPMGIINEYHEPTTFNGVNRPLVDRFIVPSTWREIGAGVTGRFNNLSLGYQAYIFNGFRSVDKDTIGFLNGANGLRGGRQKGIKSTIDNPNLSLKFDYYGIPGLRLGLSSYFGRTQADDEIEDLDGADVGISMVGFDARYTKDRFAARGEFIYTSLTDTEEYNTLTGNDLGSAMLGWYTEASYNLLPMDKRQKLFAFARYSEYNTQLQTDGSLAKNPAFDRNDLTFGLSYHIAQGVVVKGDYQIFDNDVDNSDSTKQLNFGLGFWF
ncbi:MAG: hypothetical protein CO119_10795 [Flavobacteriales bacterium CG_4_9_14_3_um_filter_40_17]|nr:MAG: hypothetical protein CO119_10795 [Flavobacteriales bacterium CG_4_9_14_3_um_filter_40_17]